MKGNNMVITCLKKYPQYKAIKFLDTPENIIEIQKFMGDIDITISYQNPEKPYLKVENPDGVTKCLVGDYIILNPDGSFGVRSKELMGKEFIAIV